MPARDRKPPVTIKGMCRNAFDGFGVFKEIRFADSRAGPYGDGVVFAPGNPEQTRLFVIAAGNLQQIDGFRIQQADDFKAIGVGKPAFTEIIGVQLDADREIGADRVTHRPDGFQQESAPGSAGFRPRHRRAGW